jgi:hypothetical protein
VVLLCLEVLVDQLHLEDLVDPIRLKLHLEVLVVLVDQKRLRLLLVDLVVLVIRLHLEDLVDPIRLKQLLVVLVVLVLQ